MQPLSQAPIRHVLVKQQICLLVRHVTQKPHYVSVPYLPQRFYLSPETVIVSPATRPNQPLYSHVGSIWHGAAVHDSRPSFSYDVLFLQTLHHVLRFPVQPLERRQLPRHRPVQHPPSHHVHRHRHQQRRCGYCDHGDYRPRLLRTPRAAPSSEGVVRVHGGIRARAGGTEIGVPFKGLVAEHKKLATRRELAFEIVVGEIQRCEACHEPNLVGDWPCYQVSGDIQNA